MKPCVACSEDIKLEAKLCKHCGTLQNDGRFGTGDDAVEDESRENYQRPLVAGRAFALSSLVLLPTLVLFAINPRMTEGGTLGVLGNAGASILGWSVLGAVGVSLSLFFKNFRGRPSRKLFVLQTIRSLAVWGLVSLLLFLAVFAVGYAQAVGAQSGVSSLTSEVPADNSLGISGNEESGGPAQAVAESSRSNCLFYLQQDWGRYGTGETSASRWAGDSAKLWSTEVDSELRRAGSQQTAAWLDFENAWRTFDSNDYDAAEARFRESHQALEARCSEILGN